VRRDRDYKPSRAKRRGSSYLPRVDPLLHALPGEQCVPDRLQHVQLEDSLDVGDGNGPAGGLIRLRELTFEVVGSMRSATAVRS